MVKKLITVLFMAIIFTGCSFLDNSPSELTALHRDITDRMLPVPGTRQFEYTVLSNGKIAGYINKNGDPGWCSNYAAAIRVELLKSGTKTDQIKFLYCSVFNPKRPDHVVVEVTTINGKRFIMDSAKPHFVQVPGDYVKKWVINKHISHAAPYLWWAKVKETGKPVQWVRTEL